MLNDKINKISKTILDIVEKIRVYGCTVEV